MKEQLPSYLGGSKIEKGGLHKSTHTPMGQKIPEKKILSAENSPKPKVRKQAVMAENFKHMEHGKATKMKMNKPAPMLGSYKKKM